MPSERQNVQCRDCQDCEGKLATSPKSSVIRPGKN
jgi:hypothetical protein